MPTSFSDPTQREIWATLQALNAAWTQGNPDDLAQFFHPRMIAVTPADRLRREGARACIAGWKGFADATRIFRWEESDPAIEVHGDAAVVSYYYEIDFEMNGQRHTEGGRDLYFLVRDGGRWLAVADQFSSYPAA